MTSRKLNELMCLTGGDAPAGRLMRLYWQPVALAEELAGPRPVKPVRIMGHDFVLFRDEAGRLGLLDRACPHRGADLAFARHEDGGLRCPFHGWLFDADGRCLETPAEPVASLLHERIRQPSYRCATSTGWPSPISAPACRGHCRSSTASWRRTATASPSRASWSAIGCRLWKSASTRRTPRSSTASIDSNIPMTTLLREYPRPAIDV